MYKEINSKLFVSLLSLGFGILLSAPAFGTTHDIIMSCDSAGPLIAGELTLPSNSDIDSCKTLTNATFGHFTKPIVLSFNSLNYVIDLSANGGVGLFSKSTSCDIDQFDDFGRKAGANYNVTTAIGVETLSTFETILKLRKSGAGGYKGSIGSYMWTGSSLEYKAKCHFQTR